MVEPFHFDTRAIREELGLSQSALAALVGISVRAIQSYEQGWRRPSDMVRRVLLLLLIAHRNGNTMADTRCWDHKHCAPEIRDRCIAHLTHQGHLCWFFTGTMCEGVRMASWSRKLLTCLECSFMRRMLRLPAQAKELTGEDDDRPR